MACQTTGPKRVPIAARHRSVFLAIALAALPAALAAQPAGSPQAAQAQVAVRGLYNWIHTTGNGERTFAFYSEVFGIALARSPFGGPGAPPESIRPESEAGSDELIWNLTDSAGSRFRTVFMRADNTPFGLELSEFFDIPRSTRPANPWDPGASILIFAVRDLATIAARLKAEGAPTVTLGGAPLDTPSGRSLLIRDPDGYLILVVQGSRAEIAGAESPGDIVGTSIGISVAETGAALAFYRDLLGFEIRETRAATAAELQLYGLSDGRLTRTTARIPGTDVTVVFLEFEPPAGVAAPAMPFEWRIQDVGAPQFQLQVTGLDALIARTQRAGYRFLSIDARPIQRPFGRFVFAIDADGVLVEYVEPTGAGSVD